MMQERGVEVDPSTLFRWVQRYAPELEKRILAYYSYGLTSWRVNETYVRVGGRWKYLFRAVDKHGVLIDFMLLGRRNTRAAHHFLSKAAVTMRDWPPTSLSTDKCPSCPEAIARLKDDGQFPRDTRHQTSKYLNNIIEADHGALKQVFKHARFSDDEDSHGGYQGLRDHAHDPERTLPHLQARRAERSPFRRLAVRYYRIEPEINAQRASPQPLNATEPE